MVDDSDLYAIKDRAADQLLTIPGVNAVGLGGRERAGQPTGEVVIKVFVSEKRPADEVPPEELVPAEFEGVPTDVVVMGPGELLQAPPRPGKPAVPVTDMDDQRQRPLVGGCQIQDDMTGAGLGTLGCFLTHNTDDTKVYALTNFHVVGMAATGTATATAGTTRVGQPTGTDSVTKCCSAIVGTYAGGAIDATRDAAVVQLDSGLQWRATILEIGAVAGTHTITVAEAATLTYQVRKRGARSQLTGGTVRSIATAFTTPLGTVNNTIIVFPNPDPGEPAGTQLFFAQQGDSGSALVNTANQVVGLLFAATLTGPGVGQGAAIDIGVVLSRFQAVESLPLSVATATDANTVDTVPGAAMVRVPPELVPALTGQQSPAAAAATAPGDQPALAVPTTAPWLPAVGPPTSAALYRLQDDLDRSTTGRAVISLWLRHQGELTDLVQTNKRVAAGWHSNGGPALMQVFVRMLSQPTLALPSTVHGRSLAQCLDRITAVFTRFASPRLRLDLTRLRAALPDLAGLTYSQIVGALDTA